jgi:small subunit ribosomal protein S6
VPFYETVFVLEPTLAEDQTEEKLKDIQSIIERKNGSVRKIERWGMRKLAYPIKHKREGMYFLVEFESGGTVVDDLEKHYRLQEFVLRYMTIRRERPSEENYVSPLSRLAETRESIPEEVAGEELEEIIEEVAEPAVDIEEGLHVEAEESEADKNVESETESITSIETTSSVTEDVGEEDVDKPAEKESTESE